jgi:hypothetical protein
MTGSLKNMPMEQLKMLFQNPQPGSPPLWAVISALAEKQKEAQAVQAAMGQGAMAQNAQMQQQPPVAAQVVQAAQGGIMQGYAGGGAVAFKDAGVVPPGLMNPDVDEDGLPRSKNEREQIIDYNNRVKAAYQQRAQAQARQAQLAQATAPKPAYPEEAKRRLEQFYQSTGREKAVPLGTPLSSIAAPAPAPVMSPEAQTNRQVPSGIMASPRATPTVQPQQRQQRQEAARPAMATGIASPVEATGTPAPDRMAEIEAQGIAGIRALQDLIRQQGNIDPRLAELREAAYKSSQDIAARRERDRQAMLEAGQKRYDDITDLLIGAAGGARGKTFGDVLSGAVGGAGAARTAKRAEFQKVQDAARQEQNAIDNLKQALADKRVADMSGDVNQRRQADMKVAEAELKISELRSGMQKERATQEDRAEQRQISREQMQSQERIAAANRAASAALRNLPGPEQQMVERVIKSLMDANPGMAYHEAYDKARGAGRPDRTVLTYDQAADNVAKFLDTQAGIMEMAAIKRRAKDAGQPEPSIQDIRSILIQRELQGAGSRFAGQGSSAPTGGVVTPKSQAEFNALPKGARYINPADGKEYIKN